jgi:chromosome segregation ATPase
MKQAELTTLQKMHETSEAQIREYQSQLTESRNRVDTLEELTSIAKRVAEAKVVEFEALKTKSGKLEEELANTKEQLRKKHEAYQEATIKFRKEFNDIKKSLENEISRLETQIVEKDREIEVLKTSVSQNEGEIARMTGELENHSTVTQGLEAEIIELTGRKHILELELVSLTKNTLILVFLPPV